MSEEPSVLILAAGASQRLGEPKALARIGPRTALEHLLTACGSNQPPTVVTGAHEAEIAAHLKEAAVVAPEANLAFNAAWARGRTGSVQRGARALAARGCVGSGPGPAARPWAGSLPALPIEKDIPALGIPS
ncbi:MAG: NTP transferase domain-containing protein [Planctomycetota bacterium]|jgi:CTP:molybdopterin cytidylyltransferase MocA